MRWLKSLFSYGWLAILLLGVFWSGPTPDAFLQKNKTDQLNHLNFLTSTAQSSPLAHSPLPANLPKQKWVYAFSGTRTPVAIFNAPPAVIRELLPNAIPQGDVICNDHGFAFYTDFSYPVTPHPQSDFSAYLVLIGVFWGLLSHYFQSGKFLVFYILTLAAFLLLDSFTEFNYRFSTWFEAETFAAPLVHSAGHFLIFCALAVAGINGIFRLGKKRNWLFEIGSSLSAIALLAVLNLWVNHGNLPFRTYPFFEWNIIGLSFPVMIGFLLFTWERAERTHGVLLKFPLFAVLVSLSAWLLFPDEWLISLGMFAFGLLRTYKQKLPIRMAVFWPIHWIVWASVFCIATSDTLLKRDIRLAETEANHLVNQHEPELLFKLFDVLERMQSDTAIVGILSGENENSLNRWLSSQYLTDELQQFEVEDFQSIPGSGKTPENQELIRPFRQPNRSGFILKVPLNSTAKADTLELTLQKKNSPAVEFYQELILPDKAHNPLFSSAIYQNNLLMESEGSRVFPMEQSLRDSSFKFTPEGEINVQVNGADGEQVVVAFEAHEFLHAASLLLWLGVFAAMFRIVRWFFRPGNRALWRSKRFTIQLTVLGTGGVVAILIGYASAAYFRSHLLDERLQSLVQQREEVGRQVREVLVAEGAQPIEDDLTRARLNRIARQFRSEFHLFNTKGMLVHSSFPLFFEQYWSDSTAYQPAFEAFKQGRETNAAYERAMGDKTYVASFFPIRTKTTDYLLELPLYGYQEELGRAWSGLLGQLINLYAALLLVVIAAAWWVSGWVTKPLSVLTDLLRIRESGSSDATIVWDGKDELATLVAAYNRVVVKLEDQAEQLAVQEKELAWKNMARQVAHEIRNPLTPMKLSLQMLQRAKKDERPDLPQIQDKVTNTLLTQIDSLERISTEFSAFANLPDMRKERVDVRALLENTAALYEHVGEVEVKVNVVEAISMLDSEQIGRVFGNLIKNAQQAYGDEVGSVAISMEELPKKWVVFIEDKAGGIREDIRDRVFEPNFTTKSSGMGLGLAMVKRIVEQHGGSISFDTETGVGTVFRVELPKA